MAPKASLSAKTAQFERFFKVPVHNGLSLFFKDKDIYKTVVISNFKTILCYIRKNLIPSTTLGKR